MLRVGRTSFDVENYIKQCLQYTLLGSDHQTVDYDVRRVDGGFLFVPVYPTTYIIDENFYNRLFTILNLALTPMFTLIRPLTMQIVDIPNTSPGRARGLFIPAREGKPKRLKGTAKQLAQSAEKTGKIPLMDLMSWDYVRSPHAVITGVSGSGKSYFLKYLFSACSSIGDVVAIDPKCSDLARLAKKEKVENVVIPEFADGVNSIGGQYLQHVVSVLKDVEKEMYNRQSQLFSQTSRISTDYREIGFKPIFVFIDELAAMMTGADKSVKTDFQDILTRLVVLGREAGVYLVLSMQSARAEYIPTIVRDSISLRVQLGRINAENSRFLFPELSEIPFVPLGGKGSGILSIAGDPSYAGIEPILTPTILD